MKEKYERAQSIHIKNQILLKIREQPLYRHDLDDMFQLERSDMTNFLTSLKKKGLIAAYKPDMHKPPNQRRWHHTEKTEMFDECVRATRTKYIETITGVSWKEPVKFHPLANRDMCKTADSYHTKGNATKLNSWSGYESMGGLG